MKIKVNNQDIAEFQELYKNLGFINKIIEFCIDNLLFNEEISFIEKCKYRKCLPFIKKKCYNIIALYLKYLILDLIKNYIKER